MTIDPATEAHPDAQQVLDSLLYSVSHDLRSPLLTMTLSAELIESALDREGVSSEGTSLAVRSLRQGAADMERMLQTLMLLSRARRKQIEPARGALQVILGGHFVVSEGDVLPRRIALVDPLQVREMLDAVAGDDPLEVHVRVYDGRADLEFPVPALEHGPTPLHAVAASLKQYAATPVETLAVGQILVERQGGAVRAESGRVVISLPIEGVT